MIIRPAQQHESDQIVDVIRSSFDQNILRATIYGATGIASYVSSQLNVPIGMSDTVYLLAESDGRAAGCVELRRFPDALFVNYIAVRPEFRSAGVARSLLAKSIAAVRHDSQTQMLLDVFSSSKTAQDWYRRLGFTVVSESEWWSIESVDNEFDALGLISGYPQAELVQDRFGFSQFAVRTRHSEYSVGRVGTEWFRLTQPGAFQDPVLSSTLFRLDSTRRILGIVKKGSIGQPMYPRGSRLVVATRMAVDLDHLVRELRF